MLLCASGAQEYVEGAIKHHGGASQIAAAAQFKGLRSGTLELASVTMTPKACNLLQTCVVGPLGPLRVKIYFSFFCVTTMMKILDFEDSRVKSLCLLYRQQCLHV